MKSNLIFTSDFSNNILFDFLDIYTPIENEQYIFDKLIYKKYEYKNEINDFLLKIKEYYKPNKLYYTEREVNYKNLLTIIRQICKFKNISYFHKIKYEKNQYYIIYYIQKS